MKKSIGIIVTLAVLILSCVATFNYALNLKAENKMLKSEINSDETADLVPCYLCGGTVKIQPVKNSFYIECVSCNLTTGYFKSKSELIKYWNKEPPTDHPKKQSEF